MKRLKTIINKIKLGGDILKSKQQTKVISEAMLDKKGEDIVVLNIEGMSSLADFFVICSGRSKAQVQAICDNVEEKLEENKVEIKRREGYDYGRWVVLDTGDIMVHIFNAEEREFYNLERLWINGENAEYINPPIKTATI